MRIEDLEWRRLRCIRDERGALTAIEGEADVPFAIKRIFYMHDVSPGSARGGHAHRDTDQMAVAVHGAVDLHVSDGASSRFVRLDDPAWGLVLPRLTWIRLTNFSAGAVCLVLANTHYDMGKSIRTWQEYLSERRLTERPEPTSGVGLARPRD